MKKQKLYKKEVQGPENVGHLEETLTEITSTTAKGLKRLQKPLLAVLLLIVCVGLLYSAMRAFESGRVEDSNVRFYRVFSGPVARGEEPDLKAVEQLLLDVEGLEGETYMASQVGSYLLTQADGIEERKREEEREKKVAEEKKEAKPSAEVLPPVPETGKATDAEKKMESVCGMTPQEARERALLLAQKTAERYPRDRHVQSWASEVKEKVDGATKSGWLPAPWKYRLPPPPPVTQEKSTTESEAKSQEGKSP